MKISSIPKSGRAGSVVYLNTRYGQVVRSYVRPRNPRTPEQQAHRHNVRAVSGRWNTLSDAQQAAWRSFAAAHDFVNETGRPVRLNVYNFFVSLNTRRADLDLPQFDLPIAEPVFPLNPVAELALPTPAARLPSSSAILVRRAATRWCKALPRFGVGSATCRTSLSWGWCHPR